MAFVDLSESKTGVGEGRGDGWGGGGKVGDGGETDRMSFSTCLR